MRIFLAGIMQGSLRSASMHDQDYRSNLRDTIPQYLPEYEIYDPLEFHAKSLSYETRQGQNVFLHHNKMCGEIDLLIAFVPEASMGTAIEMWEAWRHDKLVVTISPLKHNWAVKYLSHIVFEQESDFFEALQNGNLRQQLIKLNAPLNPEWQNK